MIEIGIVDNDPHSICMFKRHFYSSKDSFETIIIKETSLSDYLSKNSLDALFINLDNTSFQPVNILDLKEESPYLQIVLISSVKEYAVEAFDYEAVDYLLKPFNVDRLTQSINKIKRNLPKKNKNEVFIKCLGGFEIFVNDKLVDLKASKAKEILAFLINNKGKNVGWMMIADAVWPDCTDDKKLMNNFHVACYHLRKFLSAHNISDIFEYSRNLYRVNIDAFECDYYNLVDLYKKHRKDPTVNFYLEDFYNGEIFENLNYIWSYGIADKVKKMMKELNQKAPKAI